MSAKDELLGIAQLAVALIGFSGLVFVFRARDIAGLEARDLSALAMIVGAGAIALAFSLLPLPLAYVGLPEAALWRLCVLLCLAFVGFMLVVARRSVRE